MLGYRGKGTPSEEPESEEEYDADEPMDELRGLARHRAEGLLMLGFTMPQVLRLVSIPDVVHSAEHLIDKGCPVDIAFDLLT